MAGSRGRVPAGAPAGGQFTGSLRAEAATSLTTPPEVFAHHADPRGDFRVVDGECLNCGHYDDHDYCESCSPSCSECGQEREDVDRSLCDRCQEKAHDDGEHLLAEPDPDWFARLAEHQQRDLAEEGAVYVQDAGGDGVPLRPGVIDDEAAWVYQNGQCLAFAVAAAERCGGKVYCAVDDLDDVDAGGQPFYNLRHAYALTPDGELLDIAGAHGAPENLAAVDPGESGASAARPFPEPLVFDNPRDALDHFDGYLVAQDLVVAEPFAHRILADHRR